MEAHVKDSWETCAVYVWCRESGAWIPRPVSHRYRRPLFNSQSQPHADPRYHLLLLTTLPSSQEKAMNGPIMVRDKLCDSDAVACRAPAVGAVIDVTRTGYLRIDVHWWPTVQGWGPWVSLSPALQSTCVGSS